MGELGPTNGDGTRNATSRHRPRAVLAATVLAALLLIGGIVAAVMPGTPENVPPRVASAVAARPPAAPQFVTRNGTQLSVDGAPFRFLGFNSYVMLLSLIHI